MKREELIQSAKKLYDSKWPNETLKKVLEENFPELKESEDERIREALLRCCDDWDKGQFGCMKKEDVVSIRAYLEKQKAKERLDRMAPIYNNKESFESALEKAWKYYNESASRTVDSFEDDYIECVFSKGFREGFLYREKQKEQKPESCDCSRDEESYTNGIHHVLMNPEAYGLIKQKPAEWSEDIIRKAVKEVGLTQHQINWFKNNVFPPKQEWGDEDEEMIQDIIDLLDPNLAASDFHEIEKWLKSLPKRFNLPPNQERGEKEKERTRQNGRLDVCYNPEKYGLCHKIEWSEEDEKKYKVVLELINSWANGTIGACIIPPNTDRYINWFKSLPKRFNLPPKQEWSEEDEKMIERLTRILELGSKGFHADYTKKGYAEALSWLKSICPQPKAEWSEEDEKIVRFYEADYNNQIGDMSMTDVINMRLEFKNWLVNRLKSLRPTQYCEDCKLKRSVENWKPSEEQIEALKEAVYQLDGSEYSNGIDSLYNDLQKLL